jgi:hypothetical protein
MAAPRPPHFKLAVPGSPKAKALNTSWDFSHDMVMQSIFCELFQVTEVEGQLVSVAVVERIPALYFWGDKETTPIKPATPGTATNSTSVPDITDEDRNSIVESLSNGTMDELRWRAHSSAMADVLKRTIGPRLEEAKDLQPGRELASLSNQTQCSARPLRPQLLPHARSHSWGSVRTVELASKIGAIETTD